MRKWLVLIPGFLALAAASYWFHAHHPSSGNDPDRYFHIALSREMVETGKLVPRSLPQVEGLGWDRHFTDKEFLFHQLTRLGYVLGGERGVVEAAQLCALAALLVFLLQAASALPPFAALAVAVATFGQSYFAWRMALLRPHTLAVLAFLLFTVAALRRRPYLTAAAAMAFALSYHAVYLQVICLAWLALLSFLEEEERARLTRRVAFFGAFGTVAGVLANPYFPGNLVMGVIHARIPGLLRNEFQGVGFGLELYPASGDALLFYFLGPLVLLAVALALFGYELSRKGGEASERRLRLLYLLGTAGFFLALSFKTLRAAEYFIPLAGLVLVELLFRLRDRPGIQHAIAISLALLQLAVFREVFVQEASKLRALGAGRVSDTFAALAALPPESKGAKVFNCDWDRTPYILYKRPDLRFLDILDPSFLYFADPPAFWARQQFGEGQIGDPLGLIRNAFRADYVLCANPAMAAQLADDPGFQQLYPKGKASSVALFRARTEPLAEYVRSYLVSGPSAFTLAELETLAPPAREPERELELARSSFLSLSSEWKARQPSGGEGEAVCAFLRPSPAEVRRLAGATQLALGGGQGFRLWRNGKPLFRSRAGFATARAAQVVVPLDSPLRPTDRLDLLVCSSRDASFFGFSLSLWTKQAFHALCDWKEQETRQPAAPLRWQLAESRRRSCIGPMAVQDE